MSHCEAIGRSLGDSRIVGLNFTSVRWESAHVLRDPILDLAVNRAVQLGEHVCVQIAASGFDMILSKHEGLAKLGDAINAMLPLPPTTE